MTVKTYYIVFFRYLDSKLWQRSNLSEDKKALEDSVKNKDYIDLTSVNVREIKLPE